jgi:hypothetical protein
MTPLTPFDKAIIGGLTSAVLALAARYGFQPNGEQVTLLGVLLTALVPYIITHAAVYFSRNKNKGV